MRVVARRAQTTSMWKRARRRERPHCPPNSVHHGSPRRENLRGFLSLPLPFMLNCTLPHCLSTLNTRTCTCLTDGDD